MSCRHESIQAVQRQSPPTSYCRRRMRMDGGAYAFHCRRRPWGPYRVDVLHGKEAEEDQRKREQQDEARALILMTAHHVTLMRGQCVHLQPKTLQRGLTANR
jgi:hypothetical protein